MESTSSDRKYFDKKGQPAKCEACKALVTAKFCGNCGAPTLDPEGKVLGNDGWGPGSKVKRQCKIPLRYTAFNQKIKVYIQGQKLQPGSWKGLTYDEFAAIRQMIQKRVEGDFRAVHGEPGAKKHIDMFLGTIRGKK